MDLFGNIGVDVAQVIDDTFQQVGIENVSLAKRTPGTPTPGHLTAGTNDTFVSYTVRAIVADISPGFLVARGGPPAAGFTNVEAGDREVTIMGKSLPGVIVPEVGDVITPPDGRSQSIYLVDSDPLGATYTCKVR
jgi:hypothetical protein